MRRLFIFLFVCLAFGACSKDSYNTGDSDLSHLRAEMVSMHVKETEVKSIVTDEDVTLEFNTLHVSESYARPDTTYRALLYYNKVEGKPIEVISASIAKLLVPNAECKTKATDPLTYVSGWIAPNHKYVNLCLGLMLGNADDEKAKQSVELQLDSVETDDSGHKTYFVSVKHDQGGVPQYYTQNYYFSIPLDGLQAGDKMQFTVNTYKGTLTNSFAK